MIPTDKLPYFADILKDLPLEDIAALLEKATSKALAGGECYIQLHEESKKLAYIEKGIIRAYTYKENGDEATLLLRWEGQFVASHDCILLNRPSGFIYQALEDTVVLEIDYNEVEKIMALQPRYEPLRNHVLMTMLSGALKMIEDFILLNPEERYKKLVAEQFDIVNRVPDKYIASMLGITPVSLSRIRRRILKQ